MRNFFLKFSDSAKELQNVRTLTTTGIFLALAIILRFLAINIGEDLRITFTYIPIMIIAVLYGPVVCGMSTFALDILGFLIDNRSVRAYSPQLAAVVILSGVIYGIVLYRKEFRSKSEKLINCIVARLSIIIICNIALNSYFIYTLYVNNNFSIFTPADNDWKAFFIWMLPRLSKNAVMLPIEVISAYLIIPLILEAYKRTIKKV